MHALGSHLLQREFAEYRSKTTVRAPVPSALGFLVTSPSFRVLAGNQEAAAILSYPGRPIAQSVAEGFEKKLRQDLLRLYSRSNGHDGPLAIQLKSGRRTYFCRTFVLNGHGRVPDGASILVVLERGISGSCALSQVSQEFHLTPREQQAVTLLLQGLGNKEIAERLGISVNTVKAFLRLVMTKMEVSSRSEIVSKVLGLVLSSNEPKPDHRQFQCEERSRSGWTLSKPMLENRPIGKARETERDEPGREKREAKSIVRRPLAKCKESNTGTLRLLA